MAAELPPPRRIVTARRPDGSSYVAEDGHAPAVKTVAARPGYRAVNAWVTKATPCDPDAPDETLEHVGILPPKNGTILRIIDFPPESKDPAERQRQMAATFQTIFKDVDHTRSADKHPGVHTTETIDYAIVLSGEIYALLDDGEHLMKTGDVMIQRATRHGWGNRSEKPCRIAFVLIDGAK